MSTVLIIIGILLGTLALIGFVMMLLDVRYYKKKEKEKTKHCQPENSTKEEN